MRLHGGDDGRNCQDSTRRISAAKGSGDARVVTGLAITAAALQLLGYALYVRLFVQRRIRPNAASSFMFAYGTALLVLLEWSAGGTWPVLLLPALCASASIVVALLCLRAGATEPVDRVEAIAFSADVWLTLFWAALAFGYGTIGPYATGFLLVGNLTTLTAFFPVLRSTWTTPMREHPGPWIVWTCAYATLAATTWAADTGRNAALLVYPLLNVALHASIAALALRHRGRRFVDTARSVYIAPSGMHGEGMFAGRIFAPGEAIWTLTGRWVFGAVTESGPNYIGIGRDVWIDPHAPLDRLNHCCAPNAAMGARRRLRALRTIVPGEEITIDYSTTEADPAWTMRCACDAPACRGTLSAIQFAFAAEPEASPLMRTIWRRSHASASGSAPVTLPVVVPNPEPRSLTAPRRRAQRRRFQRAASPARPVPAQSQPPHRP